MKRPLRTGTGQAPLFFFTRPNTRFGAVRASCPLLSACPIFRSSSGAAGRPQCSAVSDAPITDQRIGQVTPATVPPEPEGSPALLDVRSVAQLLDCSPRHVYRLVD